MESSAPATPTEGTPPQEVPVELMSPVEKMTEGHQRADDSADARAQEWIQILGDSSREVLAAYALLARHLEVLAAHGHTMHPDFVQVKNALAGSGKALATALEVFHDSPKSLDSLARTLEYRERRGE